MKPKIWEVLMLIFLIIIMSACRSDKVDEKVYEYLEATVQLEKEFEVQQQYINALEKEDEEIYKEIIKLRTVNEGEINLLVEQAIDLLNKRLEHLSLEKASIHKSKEEFVKLKNIIDNTDDNETKKQLSVVYDSMMLRYDAYDVFHEKYINSVSITKVLYQLFKEDPPDEKMIFTLIADVNDSYDEILTANQQFNKETEIYNNLKKEYYLTLE